MRLPLLAATLLIGLPACSAADDKKAAADPKPADPKALKVGDPAPPLAVAKWLNGPPLAGLEPGTVYVLDFWATWCGPCIQMMPHLAELQAEYKDKGVVVAAVTTTDARNPLPAVEEFVQRRGPKLGFRFAVCDAPATDAAYRAAAGVDSLPSTFVVDRAGKVAFVGHPLDLDDVLPKVAAGTWRGEADVAAVRKTAEDLGDAFDKIERDPAATDKVLAGFEAAHPDKAAQPAYQVTKVRALVAVKQFDAAKALTAKVLPALAGHKSRTLLHNVRAIWASADLNPDRRHVGLAVEAADALLALDGADPVALFGAAEAHHAAGNPGKAVELAEKALAGEPDKDTQEYLRKRIAKYKGAGPDKDKK